MKKNSQRINIRSVSAFFVVAILLFIYSTQSVFAAPPGSSYAPGETISPGCSPGSSNCTVRPFAGSGANSDITSLSTLSTPLNVIQGGTGLASIPPNTFLYGSATNTLSTLPFGSNGQVLKISGGVLGWSTDLTGSSTSYLAGNGLNLATSTGIFSINESQLNLGNIGGLLGVAQGGTGATSTSSARVALGAAASGANNDITALNSLSTPLTVIQGGTGQSSYTAGDLLYASASTTLSKLSVGTNGFVLTLAGGLPTWVAAGLGSSTSYLAGNGISLSTSTNTFSVNESQLTLGNIGGTLSVAKGGTGATTTALARSSLGVAASGANSDITSLTALSTPLTAGQGGTGQSSYTTGDLLYASNSSTLSKLSAGTNGFVLTLAGGVPTWLVAGAGSSTSYLAGNGLNLATSTGIFSINESQLTLGNLGGVLSVAKGGTGTSTAFTAGSIIFATSSGNFAQNNANFSWNDSTSRLSVVGTVAGTHLKGLGSTPSISASTGAGTGGLTAPVVSVNGTDTAGDVTVTTGNGVLALGASVFTITFASPYGATPHVIFSPANAVTAALSGATNVFASASASTFSFTSGTAALTLLTTYKWTYQVIE